MTGPLFSSWADIGRVLVVGTGGYLAFVLLQRLTGKRTLAALNAFDFVVTVAFGSTLATILLDRRTPLASGVTALGLLMALQYVVTKVSVHSASVRRLVKSEPVLLLNDGVMLRDAMRAQRVTENEVLQALRQEGFGSPSEVAAVILETNGRLSIVGASALGDGRALADVKGSEHRPGG